LFPVVIFQLYETMNLNNFRFDKIINDGSENLSVALLATHITEVDTSINQAYV
jgi:hypothetical protein